MAENLLQTAQKFFAISERLEAATARIGRIEEAFKHDIRALEERLRVAEVKIAALEATVEALRETVRETVRDTIRVEIAEQRARYAEEQARRGRPELEEG